MKKVSIFKVLLYFGLVLFVSCVKDDDFKIPELQCPDETEVTKTVQEIYAVSSTKPTKYTEDDTIEGYIISNDKEGNFFKSLSVQTLDGSLGFTVPIDQTDLYTVYNPGRKVLIKLLNRHLQIDNETLEIGSLFIDNFQNEQIGRIAYPAYEGIIVKTCVEVDENSLVKNRSIDEVSDQDLHTLIELQGVQFIQDALGSTLYDRNLDVFGATTHQIQDNSRATISLKTSSFADFSREKVPEENGAIRGVLIKHKGEYQIIPRTKDDFRLFEPRKRFDFADSVDGNPIEISELRAIFSGAETIVAGDSYIRGVVTLSGFDNDNSSLNRAFIQDATAAIALSFSEPTTIPTGTTIKVGLKNNLLNTENGLLQINIKQHLDVQFVDDGEPSPDPVIVNISELFSGNFESQFVAIDKVQFETEVGTFNGAKNITDCTQTIAILTAENATFADQNYPVGSGTIYGLAFNFNGPSFLLRDSNDTIGLDGDRCVVNTEPITNIFFSELADPNNNSAARFIELYNSGDQDINLNGWTIRRYTNDNQSSTAIFDLSGAIIRSGQAFVIAAKAAEFENVFGFSPDLEAGSGSPADSNGDDNLELLGPDGTIIDVFGLPGEDGSGTNHEFEDGRALRNSAIMLGNSIYLFSQWQLWNDTGGSGTMNQPQNAPENFTPGQRD